MQSNSNDYTPQQYRKYNGQSVLKALRSIGKDATADELANYISQDINEEEDTILPEIKNVLRRGITSGFLQRHGIHYSLVGEEDNIQVDGAPKRRSSNNDVQVDGPKRRRKTKSRPVFEEDEEFEMEQASDDDRPRVKLYEMAVGSEYETDGGEDVEEFSTESEDEPPRKSVTFKESRKKY